jgi:hypothetical protein
MGDSESQSVLKKRSFSWSPSPFIYHRLQLDQKKGAQLPPLWTTLLAPDPKDPTSTILELVERMARLCSKKRTTGSREQERHVSSSFSCRSHREQGLLQRPHHAVLFIHILALSWKVVGLGKLIGDPRSREDVARTKE